MCTLRKENTVVPRGRELRGVLSSCVFQSAWDTFSSLAGEKHFECILKRGLHRDFNYCGAFHELTIYTQIHSHTLWLSARFVFPLAQCMLCYYCSSWMGGALVCAHLDCENITLMSLRITWLVFYSRRSLCSKNACLRVRMRVDVCDAV